MNKIKILCAVLTSKLVIIASRLLKLGAGTSLPGKFALAIYPNILPYLVNQTQGDKIFVTGTNGKTTTSGLLASMLKADNRIIAHNRKGANMLNGLTTAFIEAASLDGSLKCNNALLEIDEAYFPIVTKSITPNIVVLTNLFRDQLDRYGELDSTAKKIIEGINNIPDKHRPILVVNADDPITSTLAEKLECRKIYFGIDNIVYMTKMPEVESQKELATCDCGLVYEYSKLFYSHVGHYHCKCGKKRPFCDVLASNIEINVDSSDVSLVTPSGSFSFTLKMPGLYNVYNALSSISAAISSGIDVQNIIYGLENYSTVFGRAEAIKINNKQVLIQLIKNPVGATEVLKTVSNDPNSRLIIAINDNYADGRDVSWLWDAEFELLSEHTKSIICSGERAYDMATRLKYAGINTKLINTNKNLKQSIENMLTEVQDKEKLYILPTYTALLDMQKFLPKIKS